MSITTSNLTHGNNTAGGSSATTASFTVPSNQLCLALVTSRVAAADPNHAAITGWTEVLSINYDNSGSQKRLTVLRFLGTGSTGTQSITFGGQNQTDIVWVIDTFTGADTTGTNGSGAIVQTASNTDTSGTGTTLTATLAAFGSVNNATYGAIAVGTISPSVTAGTGFAITGFDNATANGVYGGSEFKNSNDTSVDFTSSLNGELGLIAIELKAAAVAASTPLRMMMGMGT